MKTESDPRRIRMESMHNHDSQVMKDRQFEKIAEKLVLSPEYFNATPGINRLRQLELMRQKLDIVGWSLSKKLAWLDRAHREVGGM
jgi:hypothetical protein